MLGLERFGKNCAEFKIIILAKEKRGLSEPARCGFRGWSACAFFGNPSVLQLFSGRLWRRRKA